MEKTLRISYVQCDLAWEDRQANFGRFDQHLKAAPGSQVIILPEMFNTGFSMSASRLAEDMRGDTVHWISQKAGEIDALVMGSAIIEHGGKYFNRLLAAFPDGRILHYDKRHLFTYAGEGQSFTAGKDRLLIEYRGWKILPLVCYDLRFPVWSRNTKDYHLLVYVANWPAMRIEAWKTLLRARAIENQCYTIGVNRTGRDGNDIPYTGDSRAVDYAGQLMQQAGQENGMFTVTLKAEELVKYRKKYPFLRDRDRFELIDN